MPVIRGVLFDFHETLISADQWMAMETGGIALEIPQRLGLWPGEPPAEDRRKIEDAYTHIRAISSGAAVEYAARDIGRIILRVLGREAEVPNGALDEAIDTLFRAYVPGVKVKRRVPETLNTLARAGYRMGIVSNAAYAPFISWALADHGLAAHFAQVTVSADVGVRKPRREIFDAALAAMRLDAAETVYVGNDYIKDVMGARLAGLRAVWIPEASARDYRAHTSVQPDAVAEGFDALPEIIGRI
ncbi:MAG: HAD family hydrolase [Armatimonadota bacterium]